MPEPSDGRLEVRSVTKIFRRNQRSIHALDATSLDVARGRFVSIIGPSGCGKSTLFNIIAGLTKPTAGDVLADGTSIVGKPGYAGYMLQKGLLLPWCNVLDNVTLGMEVRGIAKRDAVDRARPLIERYGLGGFEQHYPHELFGWDASAHEPLAHDALRSRSDLCSTNPSVHSTHKREC